jgi:hypothetical protein
MARAMSLSLRQAFNAAMTILGSGTRSIPLKSFMAYEEGEIKSGIKYK